VVLSVEELVVGWTGSGSPSGRERRRNEEDEERARCRPIFVQFIGCALFVTFTA